MNIHISCVVDNDPKFVIQAWNWLLSLKHSGSEAKPFICYTKNSLSNPQLAKFQNLGATTIEINGFGKGNAAYCNKIQQLSVREIVSCDWLILSDADICFIDKPEKLIDGSKFRAKMVDFSNPKPLHLIQWLDKIGEPWFGSASPEFEKDQETLTTNYNGGLYVMHASIVNPILSEWTKWSTKLLSHAPSDSPWTIHADQIGMALAIHYLKIDVSLFDMRWNFPTHFKKNRLSLYSSMEGLEISALHYHNRMDNHGLPDNVGLDWIDKQIIDFRESLVELRRDCFDNETFWNFRYKYFPKLGSGLGSRGDALETKKNLLKNYFRAIHYDHILDVGCGDIEVTRFEEFANYTGIDFSNEALSIAKSKRPDWSFLQKGIEEFTSKEYDICICLDVLIHQHDLESAKELINHLIRVARKGLILSIHKDEKESGNISFNTHSLLDFLHTSKDIASVLPIGSFRDVQMIAVSLVPCQEKNKNDIGFLDLAMGCEMAEENYAELLHYVNYSREKVGFFPRTVIRMHEYPWFARQMTNVKNMNIVDLGAGVCALPFLLADRGANVVTLDLHKVNRNKISMLKWNEWGFLDYSEFDNRIESYNMDMVAYEANRKMDYIYSVSVIEHMPAEVRRQAICSIAKWSKRGTILLLSLDLVPNTNALWNLSEGKVVDEKGHGELKDIVCELEKANFSVNIEETLRAIPNSRTDVSYLKCSYRG